ncbi:hypothetical protein F4V48_04570 [Lactococcus lactis subsp. hordniae]|uniref:Uncharacterized protein n=4 Tax=Lactococcus lactis TaxID=1358 RepID=A0A5M9Q6Y4_LACLH|nr:hypothetical protein F4V48_04570 [Lactococcus lactis subsp. hordniae]
MMRAKSLRQVDVMKLSESWQEELDIKMSKTQLFNYINGKSKPDCDEVLLLSKTLEISRLWLLGYDIPPYPSELNGKTPSLVEEVNKAMEQLAESEQEKVLIFSKAELDDTIVDTVEVMLEIDEQARDSVFSYARYLRFKRESGLE